MGRPRPSRSDCPPGTISSCSRWWTTAPASTPTPPRSARRSRAGPSAGSGWSRCGSGPWRWAAGCASPRPRGTARPSGWRCRPMAEPIRVLVVDDHPVVRQGLRAFLDVQPDLTVVGEAADGTGAVAAAEELHPDVVLLDLRMPD